MEDKWLKGKLSLNRSSEGICRAEFILWTGEKIIQNRMLQRNIRDRLLFPKAKSMYCILINNMISEMCFIAFRFRPFQTIDMACRIGLVLTFHQEKTEHLLFIRCFCHVRRLIKKCIMRLRQLYNLQIRTL